jgi:predicted acylesterase/phospholipase RssA
VKRIGLALSGGGFRATLYHLGVVRFLRDAGILSRITHFTAVSGGSILAAHVVLNWRRYNGTDEEFAAAAEELLRFIRLDVRNRIVRRYPFTVMRSIARWATRRPFDRMLSRSGLLEAYYQNHLYGEKCLYELPKSPELHLLSTNVSEGCLCSFTRDGLIMQRRLPGDKLEFERIAAGLATVPLAVAASSAFPGFFPPISVRAADIGASELVFNRQSFTDGGIFDNLGVRAFRFIERCWGEDCNPGEAAHREVQIEQLRGSDTGRLADGKGAAMAPAAARAQAQREYATQASVATRRERSKFHDEHRDNDGDRGRFDGKNHHPQEHRGDKEDPDLNPIEENEEEEALRFREEFGKMAHLPAAPPTSGNFDAVIASDAGGKLLVQRGLRGGGLIRTALRSSDILMDRVWQLEKEIVGSAPGFLFAPITQLVEPAEDPHAPAAVVQQQVSNVRTDFDRFNDIEIRSLAMHGYCVARHTCRTRPDLFSDIPAGPPWDPVPPREPLVRLPKLHVPGHREVRGADRASKTARELQKSAERRVWSSLFDFHDLWTYAFAPLVLLVLAAIPYLAWRFYADTTSAYSVLTTIAESDFDYRQLIELLADGAPSSLPELEVVDVPELVPLVFDGFEIVTDFHIVDLRGWGSNFVAVPGLSPERVTYEFRRMRVRQREDASGDGHFRMQFTGRPDDFQVATDNGALQPVLKRLRPNADGPPGELQEMTQWELDFDLNRQPPGSVADIVVRQLSRSKSQAQMESNAVTHLSYGKTHAATMWLILPAGHPHRQLELLRADEGAPDQLHVVTPDRHLRAKEGAVEGWQLHNPAPGRYECHWRWE